MAAPKAPTVKTLRLAEITVDQRLQIREGGLDEGRVDLFAEVIAGGGIRKGPPPVVFDDGIIKWLADGFHWRAGSAKAGATKMECEVRPGTFEDALEFIHTEANSCHVKALSSGDLRRKIEWHLAHPLYRYYSTNLIAARIHTGCGWVGQIRNEPKWKDKQTDTPEEPPAGLNLSSTLVGRWRAIVKAGHTPRVARNAKGVWSVIDATAAAEVSSAGKWKPKPAPAPEGSAQTPPATATKPPEHTPDDVEGAVRNALILGAGRWDEDIAEELRKGGFHGVTDEYIGTVRDLMRVEREAAVAKETTDPGDQPTDDGADADPREPEYGEPVGAGPAERAAVIPVDLEAERLPESDLRDAKGRPVPEKLRAVFADAAVYRSIVAVNGQNQSRVEELRQRESGRDLDLNTTRADSSNYRRLVRFACPFVVCPACEGHGTEEPGSPKKCRIKACKGGGWVSEGMYDTLTQDQKAICESFAVAGRAAA